MYKEYHGPDRRGITAGLRRLVGWCLALGGCMALGLGCASPHPKLKPIEPMEEVRTPPDLETLPLDPLLQSYRLVNNVPEYLLGAGDQLKLTLRDVEIVRESVSVRPDGNISFSLVENIRASGRTATQLDSALTAELKRYLREPKIDVEVEEYKSKWVSVIGALEAISTPDTKTGQGRYPLKTRTTVLDIILETGGPTPDAQLDQVQLLREGGAYRLDLRSVLNTGNQSHNVILQGGDIVLVPGTEQLSKKIAVLGEVGIPNVYMFSAEAQLLEALSRAGGLSSTALRDDIRVIRRVDGEARMFTVNFERLTNHADLTQNITLVNNDIIYVPRSFIGDVNDAIAKVEPLLDLLLLPAAFRDLYTTGGGLRLDTGTAPNQGTGSTVFTRALPGTGKAIGTTAEEEGEDGQAEDR
jgi:polysaccharide biosynthesis/export protein